MNTVRRIFLAGIVAAAISLAIAADDKAVKKDAGQLLESRKTWRQDVTLLQGEWTMVSGSSDGQPMTDEMRKQMKRVCKGDELTVTMGERLFFKAKITLDPSKKPKTMDYQMTDGYTKGKTQLGIYEVDGETFKACFAKPGDERPTDFTSKAGDGRTLSVWKREKQAAPPTPAK